MRRGPPWDCATKRHHESMQLACVESERALAARDEVSSAERCALAERLELAEQAAADAEVVLDRAREQHKQQLAQRFGAAIGVQRGWTQVAMQCSSGWKRPSAPQTWRTRR